MDNKKIDKIAIDYDTFKSSLNRVSSNDKLSFFYEELYKETCDGRYLEIANSVKFCYKYWNTDYYRINAVRDIISVTSCHNKFCSQCQHNLSLKRLMRVEPFLNEIIKNFDVYHITFTVPNPIENELNETLDKMYDSFRYFIRYFSGNAKIRGIDFAKYGFIGAVRSLEITSKIVKNRISFHPHFHCLFILNKNIDNSGNNVNSFSTRQGEFVGGFSDFEILIQKLWYLVYNRKEDGKRITLQRIEELKEGYSCIAKISNGEYHEVFKYAVKGCFKNDINFDYKSFCYLEVALHRRRLYQNYGVLLHFGQDIIDHELDEKTDLIYADIINELKNLEQPIKDNVFIDNLLKDILNKNITCISKSAIRKEIFSKKQKDEDNG